MPHQYKRRTFDEAVTLSQRAFRAAAKDHLSEAELNELVEYGTMAGGSFGDDWEAETGFKPDARLYYELQLYRPSMEPPYVSKYFARILVSRDRSSEAVWIKWRPAVPGTDAT